MKSSICWSFLSLHIHRFGRAHFSTNHRHPCAPLLTYLFLYCYKADFVQNLIKNKRITEAKTIILTCPPSFALQTNERCIDGIISFAHAPVNVTDFPLAGYIVCDIFCKRKYKLPSSNQSILPYVCSQTYQNRNKSWKPECVLSFNMD